MPSDLIKAFPFLFYLQIISETHRRAKREKEREREREREREKDSQTQRNGREREKEERVGRVSSGPTTNAATRSSPNPKRNGEIAPSS